MSFVLLLLLLHPFAEPGQIGDRLIDTALRLLSFRLVHERSTGGPLPLGTARQGPDQLQIPQDAPHRTG